jgi:ferredoxin
MCEVNEMGKMLILYFSGVGATKKVAEIIYKRISQNCETDIFSIETKDKLIIDEYDALIIGTPCYHAAPPKVVMDYWEKINKLSEEKPAFIYNTRGLCSLNTNRILAKKLLEKNICTIMDKAYRSPASDGSIIAPFVKRFFEFEKDIDKKVDNDCKNFIEMLNTGIVKKYIPKFNIGSIINAPNKMAGQLITLRIYLHKNKCIKCGYCIEHCPHKIFAKDKEDYPVFTKSKCENCYRCIHHCPKNALSLSKFNTPKKLLNYGV